MENWKAVTNFEDLFEVSDLGNFRRKGEEKNLILTPHKSGYLLVATRPQGRKEKCKCFRIHREVAKAFIENPENKPQVNHKDGVKSNNKIENLEWCTAKENSQHAWKTGLIKPLTPEQAPNTKLSDKEIEMIYEKYEKGLDSLRNLCKQADISHTTVLRRHQKIKKKLLNFTVSL
jgi:hypothetical protein